MGNLYVVDDWHGNRLWGVKSLTDDEVAYWQSLRYTVTRWEGSAK